MSRRGTLGILLIVAAVAAYASALDNPLVYDDVVAISDNLFVQTPGLAWTSLWGAPSSEGFARGQFRPLPMLSFALNHLITGNSPRGYRLTNLALHVAACLLAMSVLRRILTTFSLHRGGRPLESREADWAAFLGAALLALHPIHSLAVLLLWKRATLMAAVFSLAAVWWLLRLRGVGAPENATRPRAAILTVAIYVAQLLALCSKETAIALPAGLLLIELWPRPETGPRPSRRQLVWLHLPLWALSASFIAFVYPHEPQSLAASLTYLAAQAKVVWMYAAMVVSPGLLSAAYSIEPPTGLDSHVVAGGLAVAAVLIGAIALLKRAPLVSLAVLWAAFALLPTSSIMPIPLLVDEDRVYLASVLPWGMVASLFILALRLRRRWMRIAAPVAVGTLLCVLAVSTAARGALWSTPTLVWLDAYVRYPRSYHAVTNLCVALGADANDRHRGLAACDEAVKAQPHSVPAREMFVHLLAMAGRTAQAHAVLAEGLALEPGRPELERVAGHLALFENKPAEAITHYQRALAKLPLSLMVAIYLGKSYVEAGRPDDARHMAQQLLRWPPPDDPVLLIPLLNLFHSVGWDDRACAGYASLRAIAQASPDLKVAAEPLQAACGR